jgi:hypothetical protein
LQAKTQTLKMTMVSGLRIIDSNTQTGITWWNWTVNIFFKQNDQEIRGILAKSG